MDKICLVGHKLILSLFPGIGLLDRAFEDAGFCVVRGPDLLWGGDIMKFHPPAGHFWGVIGGPPCQEFSRLRRSPPTGYGLKMLSEFARCVTEATPEWWLMENVDRVVDVTVPGYVTQRLDVDNAWFPLAKSRRLRHIQFGSKSGFTIDITSQPMRDCDLPGAALANDKRSFPELCHLQGLPDDFDLPPFLAEAKKVAVGNGVPVPMGRALAGSIIKAYTLKTRGKTCACGCGRRVTSNSKYAANADGNTQACRKRAERKRKKTERHN